MGAAALNSPSPEVRVENSMGLRADPVQDGQT